MDKEIVISIQDLRILLGIKDLELLEHQKEILKSVFNIHITYDETELGDIQLMWLTRTERNLIRNRREREINDYYLGGLFTDKSGLYSSVNKDIEDLHKCLPLDIEGILEKEKWSQIQNDLINKRKKGIE